MRRDEDTGSPVAITPLICGGVTCKCRRFPGKRRRLQRARLSRHRYVCSALTILNDLFSTDAGRSMTALALDGDSHGRGTRRLEIGRGFDGFGLRAHGIQVRQPF